MWSLALVGKVFVALAGLVVVLDLLGKERLRSWERAARRRRSKLRRLLGRIDAAEPHFELALRVSRHAALKIPLPSSYFTKAEFDEFTADGHAAYLAKHPFYRRRFPGVNPSFVATFLEDPALDFVAKRLTKPDRFQLLVVRRYLERRARRAWRINGNLTGLAVPGAIALYLGTRDGAGERFNGVLWFAMCFLLLAVPVTVGSLPFLAPRSILAILTAGSTLRAGMAKAVSNWLGDDGKRVRWLALALFMIGSCIDIVVFL